MARLPEPGPDDDPEDCDWGYDSDRNGEPSEGQLGCLMVALVGICVILACALVVVLGVTLRGM